MCCPCGTIHSYPCGPIRAHPPLKTMDSPYPQSHFLSLSPQLEVETCEPLPSPYWNVNCLNLVHVFFRESGLRWVYDCSGPALSRRQFCSSAPWPTVYTSFCPFFFNHPWASAVIWMYQLWLSTPLISFSALWPVSTLSPTYHSQGSCLVMSESCTNLWVEGHGFRGQFWYYVHLTA